MKTEKIITTSYKLYIKWLEYEELKIHHKTRLWQFVEVTFTLLEWAVNLTAYKNEKINQFSDNV